MVLSWCEFPTSYHFAERRFTYREGMKLREVLSVIELAPLSDEAFEDAWTQLNVVSEPFG